MSTSSSLFALADALALVEDVTLIEVQVCRVVLRLTLLGSHTLA